MYVQRQFSHTRFIFLLILVLNTLDTKDHINRPQIIHRKHFARDLKYCYKCFETQMQQCYHIFDQIQAVKEFSLRQLFTYFLPEEILFCRRNNQLVNLKKANEKLITKYLFKGKNERNTNLKFDLEQLKREFLQQQQNLQGMQFAPLKALQKFIKNLLTYHANLTEIAICNYLLNNIQPLIMPILQERNFPVPETYAVCGFTLYQQYAGKDLYNFINTDFPTKLEIARQLLQAAIQFSLGFDNYRLYITDLTADNIVYDKAKNLLYIIDLDTVFIVDSTEVKYKSITHKHIYIECEGCFAYIADDIASYNVSDVNIYLACQFLREDLYKQHTKGFLYPMPTKFTTLESNLWQLLNQCVDCPNDLCSERFTAAKGLIQLIEEILQQYQKEIQLNID